MGAAVGIRRRVEFVESAKFVTAKDADPRRRNSLMFNMQEWQRAESYNDQLLAMGQVHKYWKAQAKADLDKNYDVVMLKMLNGPILVSRGDFRRLKDMVVNKWKDINRSYSGPLRGDTLLHLICREGYKDMLEYMVNPASKSIYETVELNVNALNNVNRTPLMLCFTPPHFTHMARDFGMDEDPDTGQAVPKAVRPEAAVTDLDWARPGGRAEREEMIKKLVVDLHADVNALDMHGYVSLHYAAINGWEDTVELLLNNHARAAHACLTGENALHFAVSLRHGAVAEILLTACPDLANEGDVDGNRPLHVAIGNGDKEMVSMLMDWKVDLNSPNYNEVTPLSLACERQDWEMVCLLIDLGVEKEEEAFVLLQGEAETNVRSKLKRDELERQKKLQALLDSKDEETRRRAAAAHGAWIPFLDKFDRGVFYYNTVTRQSQWDVPPDYRKDKMHVMKPATYGMHFYH